VLAAVLGGASVALADVPRPTTNVEAEGTLPGGLVAKVQGPNARVYTYHVTLPAGSRTGWHWHPGPHIVTVVRGQVVIRETDCSSETYGAGQSFFDNDGAAHVHAAHNPFNNEAELVVTDLREGDAPRSVPTTGPDSCFA
jgi:quercetin dioxygenase-like cupin family protein